jgi:predicted short-subunit dehydrogenase-like oxidoreductase (DUF2520 family)
MIQNIVIIGSGNVATHLSLALKKSGFNIIQVYNRTLSNAIKLSEKLKCNATDNAHKIEKNADMYVFAISDPAIKLILNQTELNNKLLVHTAGSMNINIFKPYTNRFGVMYPLQTFSINYPVNFSQVPLFIEASDNSVEKTLFEFCQKLSNTVVVINSEQRKILHLAAVFANNFCNHMYSIAYILLKQNNLSFDYLKSIITETAIKINHVNPLEIQTGPAIRKNYKVMNEHAEMLKKNHEWQKIYTFVSKDIMKSHKK